MVSPRTPSRRTERTARWTCYWPYGGADPDSGPEAHRYCIPCPGMCSVAHRRLTELSEGQSKEEAHSLAPSGLRITLALYR